MSDGDDFKNALEAGMAFGMQGLAPMMQMQMIESTAATINSFLQAALCAAQMGDEVLSADLIARAKKLLSPLPTEEKAHE